MAGSEKKVWWYLPYNDPITGKHFDFEWKGSVNHRVRGNGCPYLSNKEVWIGYNDLATVNPELAAEWHPTKNGSLKPTDVTYGSEKKVWWFFPYDDSKSGKHYDFEWKAIICARTNGSGCPFLSESTGERFVRKYLSTNNVPFETQKSFEDLIGTGGALLSYDFLECYHKSRVGKLTKVW